MNLAEPETAAHLAAVWSLANEVDQVAGVDWSVAETDTGTDGRADSSVLE